MLPAPPAVSWLPAAAAVCRLAFGKTGLSAPPHHDWGVPPDPWATEALASRAAGHPWRPTQLSPYPGRVYRAAVRRLMRRHEAVAPGAGNPTVLLQWTRDVATQHAAWLDALATAEEWLTTAIRDGVVPALGVPVDSPDVEPCLGTYVPIPQKVLQAPGRIVRLNGILCWRGKTHHDFITRRPGPYYADVRVDAGALRRLCPPEPLPIEPDLPPWHVMNWRAFGAVRPLDLGSRPNTPTEAGIFLGDWDRRAIAAGAWAALEGAEAELKALLRAGKVVALGQTVRAGGKQPIGLEGIHRPIPAEVFLNDRLAFGSDGTLYERPKGTLWMVHDGRSVSRVTLFCNVRVRMAELVAAWDEQIAKAGTLFVEPRTGAKREAEFTGRVPERWWKRGGHRAVWDFRGAATIYSQEELSRLIQINSRGQPPDCKVMVQPRDIYPPDVAEVWWDQSSDIHTPILLQRLLRGELRAFGDPEKAGAWPEWIAPRAWWDLKRDPNKEQRFEGGGSVYWHVRVVPAEVVLDGDDGSAGASASAAAGPLSFPEASYWLAWKAAAWRAFGTLDTPGHIVSHRSFDGGASQLPDESDADYAVRQDQHRCIDSAERELMDLLASGHVKATGKPPARANGERLHHAARESVVIPATTFLSRQLAFTPSGELIDRLPFFERHFPKHSLHGSDADPRFPLYHDVLLEAAGLRGAWDTKAKSSNQSAEILAWLTGAAETFLREKNAKPKRESIVRECVAALECRYEDAEAAHSELPNHLRRRRGERARKVKSAG